MSIQLLMGNEAIALGALEAGVEVVAGYPGTPSSEVIGTLARLADDFGVYVEWSTNEKVALEVAAGASYAGARSMAVMKQVGLNVASDALMSLAYIGVKGALVIVVADDPGPHSSQTEQDTRAFAQFAKVPVFDPSSPQEAKSMVRSAFDLSEQEGIPVILRPTTRVCHGCEGVEVSIDRGGHKGAASRPGQAVRRFEKDPRWIIFPKLSFERHKWLAAEEERLSRSFADSPYNVVTGLPGLEPQNSRSAEDPAGRLGVICTGASYHYALEALECIRGRRYEGCSGSSAGASDLSGTRVLKIGTPYPLPTDLVTRFCRSVSDVVVVEEQDPFLEDRICAELHRARIGTRVHGKRTGILPYAGEYSPEAVVGAILAVAGGPSLVGHATTAGEASAEGPATTAGEASAVGPASAAPEPGAPVDSEPFAVPSLPAPPSLPARPPVFCAGCPHRASFYLFKQAAKGMDAVFTGDIGCYTLGNAPPLCALDTCLCMGAGVTIATGMERAEPGRPHIGFVGDSTFFHSCMTGLVNAVYNQANVTIVVLDNSTTAMTGHQPHPGLGSSATGKPAPKIDVAEVCSALGVKFVRQVSPFDFDRFLATAREAMEYAGPAVIIAKEPCVAVSRARAGRLVVDRSSCTGCGLCLTRIGCPAISRDEDGRPVIHDSCRLCGLCQYVCPRAAIKEEIPA